MEVLHQPELLQRALRKYNILDLFDSEDYVFRLLRFQKGEYLTSPYLETKDFLFLTRGSVRIYSLMEDSTLSPVAVQSVGAILGDVEFITGQPSPFFTEARTEVECIALSMGLYSDQLHRDVRFLNALLRSVGEKFSRISVQEINSRTLRQRLLFYMENTCPGHCITSVNTTLMQLRCSRRQLQRVLADLCEEGRVEKIKKGTYHLVVPAKE